MKDVYKRQEQGLDQLDEYIGRVRSVIGTKVPLAIDHFGKGMGNPVKIIQQRIRCV